ncbi:MAG TPA: hypothetical protein PLA74_13180 [Syntrophales bacterium]|nr:hypothetical protein [Syntrophales bacterium]HPQ44352.1 hypothetical protein [Syntrophales bacterium]
MHTNGFEKTLEEIFRERADVLYRTGEALSDALRKLNVIEKNIDRNLDKLNRFNGMEEPDDIEKLSDRIDREISRYNKAREYAALRYHYLIITREAMGFRRHTWVEEIYRIPPKRKHLNSAHGQI